MSFDIEIDEQQNQPDKNVPREARLILEELNNQLGKVYADIKVPREKVKAIVDRGENLAEKSDIWFQKEDEREEFLQILKQLNRKINQTLDLRALKAEGLVKAAKF